MQGNGPGLVIREATEADLDAVLAVERAAFGSDEEAQLVRNLLADPTARPALSLLAFQGGQAVGHVLFTRVRLEPASPLSLAILAPLAVVPAAQRQGVGGALIAAGLEALAAAGVDGVFVLGDPGYYGRHGFEPAAPLGLAAPYPVPARHADAWRVHVLSRQAVGSFSGTVRCADALDRPEYWVE